MRKTNAIPPDIGIFSKARLPDPYKDIASHALPTNIKEALEWAEFVSNTNGLYRSALRRVAAYCITEVEVVPAKAAKEKTDQEKREKYLKIFNTDKLDARRLGVEFAMALMVYGNVFVSMHTKFSRYLECPDCHAIIRFEVARDNPDLKFAFENFEFKCICPKCKKRKSFIPSDDYSTKPEDLFVRLWNPHEIELRYNKFTGEDSVIWKIPREYRERIRSGNIEELSTCPLQLIEIIKDDADLRFDDTVLMHAKEGALPGIKADGWGIPSIIANFRAAWYWQLICKYNETFATDYIMPKRCISPPAQGDTPQDPVMGTGMGKFMSEMTRMIAQHKIDPTSWLISPYPVQYQTLGGDGAQFMPKDQLEYAKGVLLSSIGVPVELYDGSLSLQAAPCALRLFESNWAWLIGALQRFVQFLANRAAFYMNEEPVEMRYKRVSHADDMSRQQAVMQLGGGGQISQGTMLASLGFNKQEEQQLMLEEDRQNAELQQEQQEDLETMQMFKSMVPGGVKPGLEDYQAQQQQAQQGGGDPSQGGGGGGAPPAGGGGAPMAPGTSPIDQMIAEAGLLPTDTPEDIQNKAQTLAQQIMSSGPQRGSILRKLKQKDQQLHAIVKSMVEDMDQQAASEGKQQVIAQQYGGG